MKSLAIFFFLFFTIQCIHAQIETYDLSKYVQGEVVLIQSFIDPRINFRSTVQPTSSENSASARATYSYYKYRNTDKHYGEISYRGRFEFIGSKTSNSKYLNLSPSASVSYRKNYYLSKKQFIGIDAYTSGYLDYDRYYEFNELLRTKNYVSTNNTLNLSYGIGRIQNIEDPLRAIAIFNMLKKNNFCLKSDISHEDVDSLSSLLNDFRSMRNQNLDNVDSRVLRNANFDLLSKYLIENDFVRVDNYLLFGLLYDTWRFELFSRRKTNNELRFGISYEHKNTQDNNNIIDEQSYDTSIKSRLPSLNVSYEVNQPLNINWFITGESRINYSKETHERLYASGDVRLSNLEGLLFSTNWSLSYYPNARTNFNVQLALEEFKSNSQIDLSQLDMELAEDVESHFYSFSVGMQYYFSPQYIMFLDLGASYYYDNMFSDERIYSGTSVSVRVNYIFR